jgi:membrane protease YdiL (CAAX protease family)
MSQDATTITAAPAGRADELPPPWGFWVTLAWAVLAFGLGASVITAAVVWFHWGRLDRVLEVQDDPWFPLQLIAINAVQIAVVAVAARAAGWPAARYLGLDRPHRRDILHGIAAVLVLLLALELLTYVLGRAHITPFQTDSYRAASQAGTLPLLWLAFVVAAPLGEEIVFRGFVFRGWAASWLGVTGTIVVTSSVFAIAHTQYDWFGTFQTFCMGALFGWLRWRSGSTTVTITLHMLINFVATTWTALKVAGVVE